MRILFLTHRLPYAPNRGDRAPAYNLLKELTGRATVNLVSLVHSDEEASHGPDIATLVETLDMCRVPKVANHIRGALQLATSNTLTHILLDSPDMHAALRRA